MQLLWTGELSHSQLFSRQGQDPCLTIVADSEPGSTQSPIHLGPGAISQIFKRSVSSKARISLSKIRMSGVYLHWSHTLLWRDTSTQNIRVRSLPLRSLHYVCTYEYSTSQFDKCNSNQFGYRQYIPTFCGLLFCSSHSLKPSFNMFVRTYCSYKGGCWAFMAWRGNLKTPE
jgi:hypothetical protein